MVSYKELGLVNTNYGKLQGIRFGEHERDVR